MANDPNDPSDPLGSGPLASEQDILGLESPFEARAAAKPFDLGNLRLTQSQLEQVGGILTGLDLTDVKEGDGTVRGQQAVEIFAQLHGKSKGEVTAAIQRVLERGAQSIREVAKNKAADLSATLIKCEEGLAPNYSKDSAYNFTAPLPLNPIDTGSLTQIIYYTRTDSQGKLSVDAVWQSRADSASEVLEKKLFTVQHPYAGKGISRSVEGVEEVGGVVKSVLGGLGDLIHSNKPASAKLRGAERAKETVTTAAVRYARDELDDQHRVADGKGFEVIVYGLLPSEPAEKVLSLDQFILWASRCNEIYGSKDLKMDDTTRSVCFARYKAVRNLNGNVASQLRDALTSISGFGEPEP